MYSTIGFAKVLKSITRGLVLMSSESKVQTCKFFTKILLKVDSVEAKEAISELEGIVNQFCRLTSIENVAESAIRSLAGIMRALSKEIALPLLSPIATDKSKMEKIEEHYEKFILEYPLVDNSKKDNPSDLPKKVPESSSAQKSEKVNASDLPKQIPKLSTVKVEKPVDGTSKKVNAIDRPKPTIVKPTMGLRKPVKVQTIKGKITAPKVVNEEKSSINELPTPMKSEESQVMSGRPSIRPPTAFKSEESQVMSGRPSIRPPAAVKRPMSKNSIFSRSSPVVDRSKK